MTRLMLDGIASDAATMARHMNGVSLVAGYDDGLYKWSAADWALFPNATHVHIVVHTTTNSGHVLDVESGNDVTPGHWISWVQMRRAAGADPTIYTGQNTYWSAVRSAFQSAGVPEPHYWIANYSSGTAIPPDAIALQYADLGAYDASAVVDYWPGVDPAPPTTQEEDMILLNGFNGAAVVGLSGGLLWNVQDGQSVAAYQAAGVKVATITVAEYNSIVAAVAANKANITLTDAQVAALGAAIAAGVHIPTHLTGTETISDTLA
jgi:hypothetical protein